MKKAIIFVVLLLILVGVVSASENLTNDTKETLSVDQTPTENLTLEDTPLLENATSTDNASNETHDNPTPMPGKPTITVDNVKGTQGKYITLKATVKNSSGPVKGMKVTFTVNGQKYTAVTDANGIASKIIKCPKSAVLKTKTKKTSKKLTKTTYYSKTYTCSASTESGASHSFKVTSKKAKLVKKYKIIKKKKTMTAPLKKGSKIYKRGKYNLLTYKSTDAGDYIFGVLMAKKNTKIKFSIKLHLKVNGRWFWSKWAKAPKMGYYDRYPKYYIKIDKIKAKYTHESYKRIR